ncbi:hypothetical protein ADK47_37235 [Streptomyces rimosus subsp. rimosus]|nr:hypothetical protein ADK78_35375 [Kitasatospora aureofaciens]KOT41135.1 hypothetical protein ADK84_12100 [Streptomyces sp. NRRL WC-3701]KOT68985.1 hypothetical protein ADK47_37235 [Streptomyces rimosus subsp. rimosus]KOT70144.1 hypothetical protein ADK45_05120 [Streptomyces rimosus subsp. rimosus]KOT71636.1 hypothetical protein ADK48_37220 [Streptomyces rimosus subsp. rimosus]
MTITNFLFEPVDVWLEVCLKVNKFVERVAVDITIRLIGFPAGSLTDSKLSDPPPFRSLFLID